MEGGRTFSQVLVLQTIHFVLDPKSWTQSDVISNKLALAGLEHEPVLFKLSGSEVAQ
jgi:hypothetical protein